MDDPKQLELPIKPPTTRTRVRLDVEATAPEVTPWETRAWPPCDGWWEVKRFEGETKPPMYWWFSSSNGPLVWRTQIYVHGGAIATPLSNYDRTYMHDEFIDNGFAWRGLVKPAEAIYPCPPYKTEALMKRAQELGVTLRTLYAAVTRPQRKRNQL